VGHRALMGGMEEGRAIRFFQFPALGDVLSVVDWGAALLWNAVDAGKEVFDDIFKLALGFDDGAHALELFWFDNALDKNDGMALMLTWSMPIFSRSAMRARISAETGAIFGAARIRVVSMLTMR